MTSPALGVPAPADDESRAGWVARTVAIPAPEGALLAQLPVEVPASQVCTWVRDGEGVVAWGEAARLRTWGPRRFADAQRWWRRFVATVRTDDEIGLPGTGPVAFASFSYAPDSTAGSCLVVPRVVVGHRGGTWWRTTLAPAGAPEGTSEGTSALDGPGDADLDTRADPQAGHGGAEHLPTGHGEVVFADGARSGAQWVAAVAQAVTAIGDGEVDKVVLARDLHARAQGPIDPRLLTRRLAAGYPRTWVFCVDGLVGATPEMLVRLEQGLVTSRVLAGTIRRSGDDEHDLALAASLARSSKDLEEHEYAVRSVAEALAPHCTSMSVPESPFVLHLPNVMHLATDVAGRTRNGDTSLDLAASLHPSAAVCGTPTAAADALITHLEGMDRGRYAGPVGWMDADGDGEWGIALRSGELDAQDPRRMRLFAGCGIVAGSDPAAELAESEAKLLPMRDALTG